MYRSVVVSLCLVLTALTLCFGAVPDDVVTAEKSLRVWVDGLAGKSEAEVVKRLGAPAEKSTWNFRGTKLPVFSFKTPAGAKLAIYFADGRAVKVSYHLMSQ